MVRKVIDESSENEGRAKPVLRCDKLSTFVNPGKQREIRAMLREWRIAATELSRLQWQCFFRNGKFDPFFDPATQYRKDGAKVRSGLLWQIALKHGVEILEPRVPVADERTKRKVLPTPPGLSDPLAHLKASLGAAQVQMIQGQVIGILKSFISNRQYDFVDAVQASSIGIGLPDEDEAWKIRRELLRRQLFTVNKAEAWFNPSRSVKVEGEEIPVAVRRLARGIMSHILSQHRRPSMKRIGMVVDQRIAELSKARNTKSYDLWLRMTVKSGGPSRQIEIPIRSNDHFLSRNGERKKTFQIIEDRETKKLFVGVITDIGDVFAASRVAYAETALGEKALDFGLSAMFASDDGDLMGRDFLKKLKVIDATIAGIARHVQRSGGKPRDSKRYMAHVTRLRGYITTELRRVLNRYIAVRRPSTIHLERLDFSSPDLSRRMNRILRNCGRSVLRAKLQSLREEFGVETTEVVSAYTSQTCSCCGYVDRRNRKTQASFACLWCGRVLHADVNASRNIGSERFRSIGSARRGVRSKVLGMLVQRHSERYSGERGAPSDPRLTNPYFADWKAKARSPAETAIAA